MKSSFTRLVLAPAMAASLFLLHCGKVDRLEDCQQICSQYENCVDDDFDVSKCRDRCEERGDDDSKYDREIDYCETCIEQNNACADTGAQCVEECAPIVNF
jgi:hypothetical protein